ncbi:hypothetical protein [uncultured Gimesia sp.]|uniref:hypothetical protein n=1 Tax=uncultured Gimesia sp. TaxID=1678688 RepID=UPI0030D99535|tara:strand:- start:12842 stop:14194 length:1353 start_codon:yes stop_codon:yes gene_type:complete
MRDSHLTHWMRQSVFLGCCFSLAVISVGEAAEPKITSPLKAKPVQVKIQVQNGQVVVPLISKQATPKKAESVKVPEGTHKQIAVIEVGSKLNPGMRINTFCMDKAGNLLAACGSGPGEIRVFNPDGQLLETWNVPISPEAINVDQDGTVYVAGSGKLLKLDSKGKVLMTKDAPHAKAVKEGNAKLRDQVVQQMKTRSTSVVSMIPRLEKMIQQVKGKNKTLTELDKKRILSYERILEQYKKMELTAKKSKQPTEQQIDDQVAAMSKRKLRVSSLSANEKEIFIACSAIQGYGYEVWRTDKNFDNPSVIVKGLRGCCGQMDVQCNNDGIFVAENSRHRVNHYDRDGKLIKHWGNRDRKGVEGFGSCCNPMNVAVGRAGEVYTAESNLGYIKRYSADGKYLDFVGKVKLVPGCKNVSIMVSPDGDRVYMMDLTRNHIIVMARKPTATVSTGK